MTTLINQSFNLLLYSASFSATVDIAILIPMYISVTNKPIAVTVNKT